MFVCAGTQVPGELSSSTTTTAAAQLTVAGWWLSTSWLRRVPGKKRSPWLSHESFTQNWTPGAPTTSPVSIVCWHRNKRSYLCFRLFRLPPAETVSDRDSLCPPYFLFFCSSLFFYYFFANFKSKLQDNVRLTANCTWFHAFWLLGIMSKWVVLKWSCPVDRTATFVN